MARKKNTYYDPRREQSRREREEMAQNVDVEGVKYIEVIGDDDVIKPMTSKDAKSVTSEPTSSLDQSTRDKTAEGHTLKGLVYGINQNPSWHLCIFLAIQQFFVMNSTAVATVMQLAPGLCLANHLATLSGLLATTFFCSGLATLLQSLIGVRLPIISGASFTYIAPVVAILAVTKDCTINPILELTPTQDFNLTTTAQTPDESEWILKIQEIQGAILIASLIEIAIGLSGVVGFILQWVGPLTLTATMTLIGLQLFDIASERASQQWWFALVTVILIAMFSQYTINIATPACRFKRGEGCIRERIPIFLILSIFLAVIITWIIYAIIQATDLIHPNDTLDCNNMTYFCNHVLEDAPWFRMPYPFQYGRPILTARSVTGIIAGVMASVVESIGDYYACTRMSSAPALPLHAINRGISVQGIGTMLFGMFGCPLGTVSYTENIGAIGTTKVASRRVVQMTAVIMLFFGVLPKFSAVFVVVPDPIKGGLLIVLFGMVTGIGISNLQFVDLDSSRNLFILGFSLFFGIALPEYVEEHKEMITVHEPHVDEILRILLRTGMFVGGLSAMILDNTIPGTDKERGMLAFKKCRNEDIGDQELSRDIYGFPIARHFFDRFKWARFIPILPTFDESLIRIHKKKPKAGTRRQ